VQGSGQLHKEGAEKEEAVTKKVDRADRERRLPIIDNDYVIPVIAPRTIEDKLKHMEQVPCPTCKGSGKRGIRKCELCKKTPGTIWVTK
jgi:hypothetical protein